MQHHEDHAEQEEPKSGSSSVAGGDDHSHDHSSYHSHEDSHDHSHGHSHDHSHGSSHGHSHSHGENATGPSDIEPETKESGEENPDNPHSCGPQCGHPAVLHDGHVGYLKDGTLHCVMQTIDGKRITEIHSPSPHHDSKCARDHNVPAKEIHFDSEEHKRHRVKHDDHYDYLIGDSIFSEDGRHHGHLDVLSANEIAIAQANRNRYRGGLQKRRFSLKGTRPNFVSQIRADGELPPEERALTCCGSAQTERKKRSKSNDACANCCAPETGCCAVAMKQGDAGRFLAMIFLTGAYFLVELIVGYIIESLALQADAYHMLSDIIALCIGFSASVMATLPSTRRFTFGFVNMEVVGALVNSTFLLSTCLQITLEAATRLDPSVLNETAEVLGTRGTELLIVAVVGLVINIAGLFIFGHGHSHGEHGHSHGGGHGHSHGGHSDGSSDDDCSDSEGDDGHDHDHDHAHDHDHGHSHGHHGHGHSRGHHGHGHSHGNGHDDGHGHSHGHSHGHNDDSAHGHNDDNAHGHGSAHGHGDSHEQDDSNGQGQGQFNILSSESGNMNIQAVLLHVLGDALGSVGVIISALVISYGGTDPRRCYIDPVMSLVIVIIILTGTIPLFKRTIKLLLHSTPRGFNVSRLTKKILKIEGVHDVHDFHAWSLTNAKKVASLHVVIHDKVDFPSLCDKVKLILHRAGIHSTTVQPEFVPKGTYFHKNESDQQHDVCNEPICGSECLDEQCCANTTGVDEEQLSELEELGARSGPDDVVVDVQDTEVL